MSRDKGKKGQKDNLEEKVLFINRCSKVLKGGRKFSFSALVIVGDKNGHVNYGFAKANEVMDAIKKATSGARKNLQTFEIENTTIPYDVEGEADGSSVIIRSAPEGTGVVAGSVIRSVLEFVGYQDVVAKSIGRNNPNNMVRATFNALEKLMDRKKIIGERNA